MEGGDTNHDWLASIGRFGGLILCSIVFGLLNFIVSSFVDFTIAKRLGGVRPITSGLFAGGESYGGIDWTFTSFWGPLMSLPRGPLAAAGFFLGFLIVGVTSFGFIRNLFLVERITIRRLGPWIAANLFLWMLRFPVPIEYSLFYWTAIKF